ncbi:hypothetical protein L8V92_08210 [Campylobacter lari]|nr:hypothetical protein [Campylobacter lari]
MENRDTLLKALSSLSEKKFNTEECSYLLEILERTFLDKLYYIDSNKKKEICKNIIKILKNHWKMFF